MPFWGSGSNSNDSDHVGSNGGPKDFSSSDETSFDATSSSGFGGGNVGAGAMEMQEFSVALQQSVLIQTIITSLSDTAFLKCIVGKPGDSLTGKEVACIHATVGKMMDTNEFMMGRLAKKQQQASGVGGGGY